VVDPSNSSYVPVDISGLTSGVAAVSAGAYFSCALTTNGDVRCWGINNFGQLGDGTNTHSKLPVDVSGLGSGATAVGAGYEHACAVTAAGGVRCWGQNVYGQLGDGSTTNSNTAVDVVGLASGVAAVSAGLRHTCALTTSGGVKCWGSNDQGRLGDGSFVDSNVPVDVDSLSSGVAAVSAGGHHTCALMVNGGAKCWGDDQFGEVGNDPTGGNHNVPVDVSGLTSGVVDVSAGDLHACSISAAGDGKCWGYNYHGQLGDGNGGSGPALCFTYPCSRTPVDVLFQVKLLKPGDTDGDGCPDEHEHGLVALEGGLRDFQYPWDYYDVLGPNLSPTRDGVIDLANDILGVILHYSPTGASPYDVRYDRGPIFGSDHWERLGPDSVIDLPNDILGVILQFGHDCM